MDANEKYDTVVVGAGISGLYAAYLLQEEHDRKVIVLEAKERIGGRMVSAEIDCAGGTKDTWDLGGQWVGPTQLHLLKVLKDFGLEIYPQYHTGTKKLMLRDPSDIRSYSGLIPTLGPLELLEINSLMNEVEKLSASLDLEDVLSHPNAMEWDSMTLHSYVTNRTKYEVSRDMIETAIRIVLGTDIAQTSMLYFLYYCKQGGGFQALLDTEKGGAQEFRVKGSMFQVCQRIADKLQTIVFNDPVVSINQRDLNNVTVTCKSGETYECKQVIMAIPPNLVNHIDFSPTLPYDRVRLGEMMPVGHLIKFIITYETAFWKEKGLSGETTVTAEPGSVGPITCTFDATSSKGNPAIVGFICADHAIYWTRRTSKERELAVFKSLATMLGDDCLNYISYIDKDWAEEPYNGGCPVGVMRPRGMLYYHHALRESFDRIHWAGTETARAWVGYIEGGIESAKRAVSEVLEYKSLPLTPCKESTMFKHKKKYVSAYQASGSNAHRLLRLSIGVAIASVLGWYIWKKFTNP